ncbi:MAG: hypothetical protein L0271_28000 [Gemmatimonadetes bacterium]|nr:hypothetical protein [Gemmatimonadota bacterium]
MSGSAKSQWLQIRVTPGQKAVLRRLARNAGQDLSSYVLHCALPDGRLRFAGIIRALRDAGNPRFALAELNDLLSGLTRGQLADAVAAAPRELGELSLFLQNYIAAMVDQSADQHGIPPPSWGRDVPALDEPHFATPLRSLRLHLLRASPVAFRRRNIFIDAGVGARV